MVSIPRSHSGKFVLGLSWEVIGAELVLFQEKRSQLRCGRGRAQEPSREAFQGTRKGLSSVPPARYPWEGPRDGYVPPLHQGSLFSRVSHGCVLLPSQDPSVTQLTSAPQGGLAEFNPFSEVGEHALFLSPWALWLVLGFWGKEPWQRQKQL